MNFLANENFPRPSFLLLREHYHHVMSISEIYAGIADEEVIKIAVEQNLIILTFDKDYGEIIFRYKYPKPPSVVYFKFKGSDPLCWNYFTQKYRTIVSTRKSFYHN